MPLFVTLDVVLAFALLFLAMTIIPAAMVKSIHRTKTWFSLLISCVVYCLSFFLLLGQQSGPQPPLWLCLISASLVYAGSPLIAAAGLILIVEVHIRPSSLHHTHSHWLYLRLTSTTSDVNESRVTAMLWCLPVVHAVVFWVAMLVERGPTGFYCHVEHPAPYLVSAGFIFFCVLHMIILQGYTFFYLLREMRLSFRDIFRYFISMAPLHLRLFVRSFLYTLVFCGVIILVMTDLSGLATHKLLAFVPLSIAILFGSQADILQAYMFWRPAPPSVPPKDWRHWPQSSSVVTAEENSLDSV